MPASFRRMYQAWYLPKCVQNLLTDFYGNIQTRTVDAPFDRKFFRAVCNRSNVTVITKREDYAILPRSTLVRTTYLLGGILFLVLTTIDDFATECGTLKASWDAY